MFYVTLAYAKTLISNQLNST